MQQENIENLEFIDVGTMKYGACLELQHELHGKVVSGKHPGAVIFVEHEPVITFGKNADQGFLHISREYLEAQGVDLYNTDRGGEITAHMPGQLVVYPILSLPAFRLGARDYISVLENTVIGVLAGYGVSAATHKEYPGVWVGDEKVCAVGVRIKNRTSMHGIAFNVSNSLELFSMMTPCGIKGKSVTTLSKLLGSDVAVNQVKARFTEHFKNVLSRASSPASSKISGI